MAKGERVLFGPSSKLVREGDVGFIFEVRRVVWGIMEKVIDV